MSGYYPVRIQELHYIAPLDNLDSIFERGILSHNEAEPFKTADLSMDSVQQIRAKKLIPADLMGVAKVIHECVNLYFNAKNPMLSTKRGEKDFLCVLRIKPEVLHQEGAVVSDQNAATNEARFYKAAEGVSRLAADILFGQYWTSKFKSAEENKLNGHKRSAELLLPGKVHPSYIGGMYVASEKVKRAVLEKFPLGCPVEITVHPSFFFENAGYPHIPALANKLFPQPIEFPEEAMPLIPKPLPIQESAEAERPSLDKRKIKTITTPNRKLNGKRKEPPKSESIIDLFSRIREKNNEAMGDVQSLERFELESLQQGGEQIADQESENPISLEGESEESKSKKARTGDYQAVEDIVEEIEPTKSNPHSPIPFHIVEDEPIRDPAPNHYTSPKKGLDGWLVKRGGSPHEVKPYQYTLELPPNFRVINGNLLDSKMQTLVNTVNCEGVMGKGIALEFKKKYSHMFADYKARCDRKEVKPGIPYTYKHGSRLILNFPTKDHWRYKSNLHWIVSGLDEIVQKYQEWGITSLAIPPLGCGNGGLDWRVVRKLIVEKLSVLPREIQIEIYNPETKK